eukprot:scaffold279333_cov21-Prasinocladus_malaysianus.AAC.1
MNVSIVYGSICTWLCQTLYSFSVAGQVFRSSQSVPKGLTFTQYTADVQLQIFHVRIRQCDTYLQTEIGFWDWLLIFPSVTAQ